MKPAILAIAFFLCIPAMAQDKADEKLDKNIKQQALCNTRIIEDAELRYNPVISDNTNIILPKGTKVYVYFGEDSYWFIRTDKYEGYVNERRLRVTTKMQWVKDLVYGKKDESDIKNPKVWIGMSKTSVLENLGEPELITVYGYSNSRYRGGGRSEAWFYEGKRLSFQNDILVSLKALGR